MKGMMNIENDNFAIVASLDLRTTSKSATSIFCNGKIILTKLPFIIFKKHF